MPLTFDPYAGVEQRIEALEVEPRLVSKDGKKRLGKLKYRHEHRAIGVVFFEELEKYENELYVDGDVRLIASRPAWWPKKAERTDLISELGKSASSMRTET